LQYNLEKYLVKEFVNFSRRVLRYTSPWVNEGKEIVTAPSGSADSVFEQFFEENERYPVVTVTAGGGTYVPFGFNDILDVNDLEGINFGTRSHKAITLSSSKSLAVQVSYSIFQNMEVRGLSTIIAASPSSGDLINVIVYQNYTTSPIAIASSSVPGIYAYGYHPYYIEFNKEFTVTDSDIWITYQTSNSSVYYVGIDKSINSLYTYNSTTSTGSINGSLICPINATIGGRYEGSVTINCMSKNDTAKARDLAEILALYIGFAKKASLSRNVSTATDGMELSLLMPVIEEWNKKGIVITSIRQGTISNRRRGENDLIFVVPVTVGVFTEYSENFGVESIDNITVDVEGFNINVEGI